MASREHRWVQVGEIEKAVAGDEAVRSGDARERDQIIVVGVGRDIGRLGRVRNDHGVRRETIDELGGDGRGDEAPELRAGQHVDELVEPGAAGDQLEALLRPGGEDLPRRASR